MNMKKIVVSLSVLCLVLLSAAAFGQNILVNPGFEDGTGTPPPPWFTYGGGAPTGNNAIFAMETAADRVHSGTKSFSVTGNAFTPILGSNGPRQGLIPIDPSGKTKYQLRAWIKKTTNLKVRLRWHQINNLGNIIVAGYSIEDLGSTGVWREISTDVIQLTAGCKYLLYTVYVEPNGSTNKGSVYIDDCGLYPSSGGAEFGTVSGTVQYGTTPIPGAMVGIAQTASATADALEYVAADQSGHYGPVYIPNGTVYIAAWKEGWAPSADVTITSANGSTLTANPTLTSAPGFNLCWATTDGRTPQAQASSAGSDSPASMAIDNDLETLWTSTDATGADQYLIIDLDPQNENTFDISGITIYWHHSFPTAYTVEYRTDFPDPFFGWTTAYSTTAGTGGFQADPDDPYIEVISFGAVPINARAIRIHCTAFNGLEIPHYGIWEVLVHSATDYMGSVYGYIKDASNQPIEGALVHLGAYTTNGAAYRQKYSDAGGFYSFAWFPGYLDVMTADALGYGNIDLPVMMSSTASPTLQNFTLPTKAGEASLVPNWNFEQPDSIDPSKPQAWTIIEDDPQGEVILSRATDHNHTPGGTACGQYDMRNITDPDDNNKWAGLYSEMFPVNGDGLHAYNVWLWRANYGWETYRNTHRILWLASDQTTVLGGEVVGPYGWGRWAANWEWWRTDAQYRRMPPTGTAYMIIDQIGSIVSYNNGEPTIHAVDDIIVEEVPLTNPENNSVYDAKTLADGTRVSLLAKQLTRLDSGSILYNSSVAYVQDLDRSSGIRVDTTGNISGELWVGEGDTINIAGTIGTTPQGEKYIAADIVNWLLDTRAANALGMNNRAAYTKMAQGLFVKLSGTVSEVGTDYFVINDGSGNRMGVPFTIKVYCGTLSKPAVDQFVRVRGVLSTDGTNNILLMRNEQVDWADGASTIHPLPFQGPVKAVRDYLFLGVFGDALTDQATQLATDYIAAATSGEITESIVRPSLGDAAGALSWIRHDGWDEEINLNRIFDPTNTYMRTAYAHVYVWSPIAQFVDIPVGSDDGIRVWVNGSLVWSNDYITRTINYGQDCISGVMLNAGLNSVLIKVTNGNGDYLGLVTQFATPGSWAGEGWGNSTYMEGLGYLINNQP